MAHGSRLMAHGQARPGEAHGSWPDAALALGTQEARGAGPEPEARLWVPRAGQASGQESHEPPLASLGHEP